MPDMPDNKEGNSGLIDINYKSVPKICVWQPLSECIQFDLSISLKNISLVFESLKVVVSLIDLPIESHIAEFKFDDLGFGLMQHLEIKQLGIGSNCKLSILDERLVKLMVIVSADGNQLDSRELVIKLLPPISIKADIASVYSVVFHQNHIPLISSLKITNNSSVNYGLTKVCAEFDPNEFEEVLWNVDELLVGQTAHLNERALKFSANSLLALTERKMLTLKLSVWCDGNKLVLTLKEIELLPKYHWGGELHMPELLAAFVTPNTYYSDSLLKKASNLLGKEGHDSRLDGYQSATREKPYMVAASLWAIICNEGISYSVPPASFAKAGQKIRTASEISRSLLATCLDTALLFASCLEQAGLNPLIALTKGHAMVGVWLVEESFPLITNDDPSDLRNRIALKDLILFETTLATNDRPIKFEQAIDEGVRRISENSDNEFVYVVDIRQARSRRISPIDVKSEDAPKQAEGAVKIDVSLPLPPVLPSVNASVINEVDLSPEDRVDQWKRKLLDLTKRNKLLNIRQRSMGFRIICPDIDKLEDNLATGRKYNVISKEAILTDGRSSEQFTLQTGASLQNEVVGDQLDRGTLIADSKERDLEKDLINLFRRSKSDIEEGGANTLFMTLGMLKWKEDSKSDQYYKAPLILLPVQLTRTSAGAKPKIMQIPDEEPVFNLTLIELLLQDHEIDLTKYQKSLPKDHSGVDVKGVWYDVRNKIKGTGFEVTEELFLSNFSFAKYLMWKDLSDRISDLKKSKLVNHLVERPAAVYSHKTDFLESSEVDKINPADLYAPLNADSPQIVAIDASTKGGDFILEGPPGTGKSETIANIIAHNLCHGKKVLFVSEKMAALDVVYSRLKRVGLGHVCLELHSSKATKKAVIDQLKEAWEERRVANSDEWKAKACELKKIRDGLNVYVEELHKVSPLGFSVYQAIVGSVNSRSTARVDLGWGMDMVSAPARTTDDVNKAIRLAKDLGLAYKDIVGLDPVVLDCVSVSDWSPIWQSKLISSAAALGTKIDQLRVSVINFLAEFGVTGIDDLDIAGAYLWCKLANVCELSSIHSIEYAVGVEAIDKLKNLETLARLKEDLINLIEQHGLNLAPQDASKLNVNKWEQVLVSTVSAEVKCKNIDEGLNEFSKYGIYKSDSAILLETKVSARVSKYSETASVNTMFALPLTEWNDLKKIALSQNGFKSFITKWKINSHLKSAGFHKIKLLCDLDSHIESVNDIIRLKSLDLEVCLSTARLLVELHGKISSLLEMYCGDDLLDTWQASPFDIRARHVTGKSIYDDVRIAAAQLDDPVSFMCILRKKLVIEHEFIEHSPLLKRSRELTSIYADTIESLKSFDALAGSQAIARKTLSNASFCLKELASHASDFNAWCHWVGARDKAKNAGLGSMVDALVDRIIDWYDAEDQFVTALRVWAAPLLISDSKILCAFSASKHNDLIEEFRVLDAQVSETTGHYIAAKLAGDRPDTTGPNAPHEYGVLAREIQRNGQKPVRQLISELGGSLLDLTPCFMMSPLSVAQYLPSGFQDFDLVVFDEASQITVWDAVGAIARGKNVIVVGDPKQMPPTNFFNRSKEEDDGDEADLESILDQAMAARVSHHRLTGHYRSRHESLIAFSNHQYYGDSLTTYPSADTKESAVIWHRVEGLYSRGADRNNPIEARAVVAEVVRRLNDPVLQKLSIGIVALNTEQQRLIENLLDDERRKDSSLERFFKDDGSIAEPVFVKNLETVQGDQRDVICLSVGYAPIVPGAQTMSMNFGPLNRQGGERRLNVAITRASTEMLLFTSFDSSMIDLSRTSSEAVKDLKAYIEYADKGPSALAERIKFTNDVDRFDSEFEQTVAAQLREKGWQIRTQIGVSKFRIDMGVLDPDVSGSFLVGIECDGATYHSSPSARDRDRVRHIILENLGWSLVRIWSTDYFVNPVRVIERVHQEILAILEVKRVLRYKQEEGDVPVDFGTNQPVFYEEDDSSLCGFDANQVSESLDNAVEEDGAGLPSEMIRSTYSSTSGTAPYVDYEHYNSDPTLDPRSSDLSAVSLGLSKVVEQEGPMLAKRAYDVYLRNCGIKRMGKDLQKLMNRALQQAIRSKLVIKVDECGTGGLLYSIIRKPWQASPRLRTRGDRSIDEIPPSEIRMASKYLESAHSFINGSEEHMRHILSFYDLKRLTDHTREFLSKVLSADTPSIDDQ